MKQLIFFVITIMFLENILITSGKSDRGSNVSEDINAILQSCPKNSVNNTCEPHLIINIHMSPSVDVSNMQDTWILDEVYDPTKRSVSKIISPYLIVVSRGEPVVMYPLQYENTIKHAEISIEQPSKVTDSKGSPSSQGNEPSPEINTKEREEVEEVQNSPLIIMKESEEVKEVQDIPRPLINMNETTDEQPTDDDEKDVLTKTNELFLSINIKEREKLNEGQSTPASKTIETEDDQPTEEDLKEVIMREHLDDEPTEDDMKGVPESPPDETNEPSSLKYTKVDEQHIEDEVKDVQSFPSGETNEGSSNMKGGKVSRSIRKQGLYYTSKKSLRSNIKFPRYKPDKKANIKHEISIGNPNYISSLGLVQVIDPSIKTNQSQSSENLERISKYKYPNNNRNPTMKDQNKIEQKKNLHSTGNKDKEMLDMNSKNTFYQASNKGKDIQLESTMSPDNKKDNDDQLLNRMKSKHNAEKIENYTPRFNNAENENNNIKTDDRKAKVNDHRLSSKSYKFFPYEEKNKEEYLNIESTDNSISSVNDFLNERKRLEQRFKLPSSKLNERYDFKQPPNAPTDLNDRKSKDYNFKTAENNIYKENYLPQRRVPEYERTNEFHNAKSAKNNILKENNLLHGKFPEYDRRSNYYHPKSAENNIFKEHDLPQGIVPEYDSTNTYYSAKSPENSIYKEHYPAQERVPQHDRMNEFYKAKTVEDNMYNGNGLTQGSYPEQFNTRSRINNYPNSENSEQFYFNEPMKTIPGMNDIPNSQKYDQISLNPYQSSLPNFNDYSLGQTNMKYYHPNSIVSHNMRENLPKNNIYEMDQQVDWQNSNRIPHNFNPEDNPKNIYIYENDPRNVQYNFNPKDLSPIPVQSYSYSKFPQEKPISFNPGNNPYSYVPFRGYGNLKRIRRSNNPSPMIDGDSSRYENKLNRFKSDYSQQMEHNGEVPCDTCGGKNKKKDERPPARYCSALADPKSRESNIEEFHVEGKLNDIVPCDTCGGKNKKKDDKPPSRYCSALTDPKSPESIIEGFHVEGKLNDIIPCDTCGGKNKKKDDKPAARYCFSLIQPKTHEGKMEDLNVQEKLTDVIPCDTCGGKNKKGGGGGEGGKPLPDGLQSETIRIKKDNGSQLTSQYMIPCEKCKGNVEGNLATQSCGCVGNPSICSCEPSKYFRAANNSKEELSYGVFKLKNPVPFLTIQVRVFRRRHNTWWRVVPIVTLDSVSGIFANKNLSVVFSSRVGTFRQEKSSSFVNHKLVVPITSVDDHLPNTRSISPLEELENNIGRSFLIDSSSKGVATREKKDFVEKPFKSIDIIGIFPASMKALQKCPHKDKHLCLNIRGERVPAFSIKVKIPFRENAFMIKNKHAVKISKIITDATTKDALRISIDVINKGLEAHEYSIYVYNCPLSKSALSTTSVRRYLQPDIGQTVNFLLPYIIGSKKNKKFSCDVVVKECDLNNLNTSRAMELTSLKGGFIAKRPMDIKVHSRCFCIWRCRCHCMEKLESFINYNVCERMSRKAQEEAGLIYNCPPGDERNDICITDTYNQCLKDTSCNIACQIQNGILLLLILLLLLGLLKAIIGLCVQRIDKWGFERVQPGRYYACTSRIRIFIVNVFMFIIFPFACWCKCFQPKPEDLMAASTDWSCNHERDDDDCCSMSENKKSGTSRLRLCGGDSQNLSENLLLSLTPHYENGLFKDDKPDDEESTAFILEVLAESKTSLSKMMSQSTTSPTSEEMVSKCGKNSEEDRAAEKIVDSLKTSQTAYRTMSSPVGDVIDIAENCQYCVKGFFLPTIKNTYDFFSYHPLVQYIGISKENEVKELTEPKYLHTHEFSRTYANKTEVFEAGDLSVNCPDNIPCINISPFNNLENSFVKLSALIEEKQND